MRLAALVLSIGLAFAGSMESWAEQSEMQRLAVAGWVARAEGRNDEALALAATGQRRRGRNREIPVTPGSIRPSREMLAELLLELGQPAAALTEFEKSQRTDPNRLHGLAGAARAAEQAGDRERARRYHTELLALTKVGPTRSGRR
jgi:tetratricopeptide (TPR) repeat protein